MCTINRLNKIGSFVVIVTTLLFLVSCKGGIKSNEQDQLAADTLNKELLASDIEEVLYPLPAPFEMTQMLNNIGAKYNSKNVNPANKAEKYITEQSKALNLGIYAADLAYAATFDQQQEVQTYLSSIKTLADQLGVTYDYTIFLSDESKTIFENKDSLTNLVTNTIYDTYQYLDQKSNPDLAVDMVAGVWVELMYIATNISEDSYNFTGLVDIISKQKASYEKVMSLLAARNSNPDIKSLETKLLLLQPVYDKVDTGLSQADYTQILKTIKEVRNSLI
ncbi:MAG: hypothetical protein EHM20_10695 [Alphaproteobacteria bacterium]|nr:MAG: hypothetical protein EHM20_10695 [Alphaproteobacteria bacterium]